MKTFSSEKKFNFFTDFHIFPERGGAVGCRLPRSFEDWESEVV